MKFKKFLFKKVQSTNKTALRLIKSNLQQGIVLTEVQSKGRGQRGNKWISKKGNLFMSVFFEINKNLSLKKITRKNLSIIKKIISEKIKFKVKIKLPNDILIDQKKICGILQEILFNKNRKFLVVGIGINLCSSPSNIKYETTYLNNYSNRKINKIKLINDIKFNYEKNFNYFKK